MTVAAPPVAAPAGTTPGLLAGLEERLGARRLDVALSLCFVLIGLILYFWRIEEPWNGSRAYIYDEVYHAFTAAQYVNGNTDAWVWWTSSPVKDTAYEWTHPPLGKEIIAVGIWLFGDAPFGWRFTSAIVGAIGLGMIYWLAFVLTRRRVAAILAAVLTLVDGLYFVESRSSLLDIYGAVFMVGAFIAFYAYLSAPANRVRWPLLGMGLGLGLAIATKWNAGYASAIIGLVVMARTAYLLYQAFTRRGEEREAHRAGFVQHLIWVPLGMAVLPAAIYMLTYAPFFGAGFTLDQFRHLQWEMYHYHSNLKATHQYQSAWWQWPLTQRPVWYGVEYVREGYVGNTYANGNPLLYWSFFAAVPYTLVLWWQREKYRQMLVLAIGFFGQWLPWALVPRIAYAYHFLPAAIFGILAVAVALDDVWSVGERQPEPRRAQVWPIAALGILSILLANGIAWGQEAQFRLILSCGLGLVFAALCLLVAQGNWRFKPLRLTNWQYVALLYATIIMGAFIFFYPIYSNWTLTEPEIRARIWIDSWR